MTGTGCLPPPPLFSLCQLEGGKEVGVGGHWGGSTIAKGPAWSSGRHRGSQNGAARLGLPNPESAGWVVSSLHTHSLSLIHSLALSLLCYPNTSKRNDQLIHSGQHLSSDVAVSGSFRARLESLMGELHGQAHRGSRCLCCCAVLLVGSLHSHY